MKFIVTRVGSTYVARLFGSGVEGTGPTEAEAIGALVLRLIAVQGNGWQIERRGVEAEVKLFYIQNKGYAGDCLISTPQGYGGGGMSTHLTPIPPMSIIEPHEQPCPECGVPFRSTFRKPGIPDIPEHRACRDAKRKRDNARRLEREKRKAGKAKR